jgi:hypothetical protein
VVVRECSRGKRKGARKSEAVRDERLQHGEESRSTNRVDLSEGGTPAGDA